MIRVRRLAALLALSLTTACGTLDKNVPTGSAGGVSAHELLKWTPYGIGEAALVDAHTVRLSEGPESKGFMIVSPDVHGENVVIRYRVKALSPQTVLVVALSLSDIGEGVHLTVPDRYDGNNPWLQSNSEHYFFAFCNAAHNATPFVRRFPQPAGATEPLAVHPDNLVTHGKWFGVEAGRAGSHLWLKLDGNTVFVARDDAPLGSGHIALRIRGTADGAAECLVRDVAVE